MLSSDQNVSLLPLISIPAAFIAIVFIFVLSKQPDTLTQEFVVGLAAVGIVAVISIACLITAAIYSRPRYDW